MSVAVSSETDPAAELLEQVRALEPMVQQASVAIETERRLPEGLVDELRGLGVFRLAVPREYGGPEHDPLTQVQVVEELSRQDGSVGWCAMIGAAASYAAAFLEPEAARQVFGHRNSSLAGLIAPAGLAEQVDGGYRISGRFRFASGSSHASAMIGGCMVMSDGEPVRSDRGVPAYLVAVLEPDQVTMLDTWHTTGLAGTASHDYDIDDAFVSAERTWDPSGAMRLPGPLYQYPPLFLCPHAGVPLGIARHAIDTVVALAEEKDLFPVAHRAAPGRLLRDDVRAQEAIARAEAMLGAARAYTYTTLGDIWQLLRSGERPSSRQRGLYRAMLTYVHELGRDVVELMYNTASTGAIYRSSPLDRAFRDMTTACQHRMVNQKIYQPVGRVLLGMRSEDPFV